MWRTCHLQLASEQRPYLLASMLAARGDCLVLENLGKQHKCRTKSLRGVALSKHGPSCVTHFKIQRPLPTQPPGMWLLNGCQLAQVAATDAADASLNSQPRSYPRPRMKSFKSTAPGVSLRMSHRRRRRSVACRRRRGGDGYIFLRSSPRQSAAFGIDCLELDWADRQTDRLGGWERLVRRLVWTARLGYQVAVGWCWG